jgi:N4-gp56 family major capsid protein
VTVPQGHGDGVKIPRWFAPYRHDSTGRTSAIAARSAVSQKSNEASAVTPIALSADVITGAVALFDGAIGYSDKAVIVSYANIIEGAIENLVRELALDIDTYTRNTISGSATVKSTASSPTTAVTSAGNVLNGQQIAKIPVFLDSFGVPRWDDETFVAVCHPRVQHDIYTDISSTGFVSIAQYGRPDDIYRGEIGRMYGVRLLLSNNVPVYLGGGSASATILLSTSTTGSHAWCFSPDAFYSLELAQGGVQVIHHPPGSAGSDDPTNTKGSVGIKVYYGAVGQPSADKRLLRFACRLGLSF